MAKLRKMLGSVDAPQVTALMRLMETQSKATLIRWAAAYVEERYLEIYEKTYPEDGRLRALLTAVREFLDGKRKQQELKALLREARPIAQQAEGSPAAQAAARAVTTACATAQTPTSALGFTFYGAAAVAYDKAGLSASPECYDAIAAGEFERIVESLRKSAIPHEENPVKLNWYC